mmetsp:Transcript_58812/g.138522  ORF Transcript_58812/g.138522 Transcript_58812/m.138522 type:complete len:122 (+) Transcript_58812:2-367(+)
MLGCAPCHEPRAKSDRVKRLGDTVFHASCFTCSTCRKTPPTKTAPNATGQICGWCNECYESQFSQPCDHCGKPLGKTWSRVKMGEMRGEVHPECKRAWFDAIPESSDDSDAETDSDDTDDD